MAASLSGRSALSLTFILAKLHLGHSLQGSCRAPLPHLHYARCRRADLTASSQNLSSLWTYPVRTVHGRRCSNASKPRQACILVKAQGTDGGNAQEEDVPAGSVSVVLLAGGVGKRMGASMPKQYLPIRGQPIALFSLALFASLKEVGEIIVVCDPSYRQLFEEAAKDSGRRLQWASPGKERQDSVFNGLQEVSTSATLVCVHDSARPLLTQEDALHVFRDALRHGAAVLGVPVKQTIKEAKPGGFVERTLDRSKLWEMQTPQVIKPDLLRRGFDHVRREGLEVTDDVSIVEYLNAPVKITQGSYTNLKVTTPEDLLLAEKLIAEAEEKQAAQQLDSGVQAVHVSDLTLQQV